MESVISILPDSRWKVIFQDQGSWRVGIYRPEHPSPGLVDRLEKHTCPELFICAEGAMGLIIEKDGKESIIRMNPHEAVLVTDYHNGFSIDPKGFFIVVEQTDFSTDYKDRISAV